MSLYIIKRLLLMIPTLLGIMLINFIIIQAAPGGPIQQMIAKIRHSGSDVDVRMGGGSSDFSGAGAQSSHDLANTMGIDPRLVQELEKQFGFDKPPHERFIKMLIDYIHLDFGKSFYKDQSVLSLIISKMPVSLSLGLWTTLLIYFISIPLGIKKAICDGSSFDIWTSGIIIAGYAIPSFLFALFLMIFFAGGSFLSLFPLRGLYSNGFETFSLFEKIIDYLWHLFLPIFAMVIGGFAKLTLLTKNSFMDEINKLYVLTARAKGLTEKNILYKHVFRNAMLIVIAGFPAAFVGIFFTSSLLIEVLFSLDGMGLLGFEAAMTRDYPVMFGTLFLFTTIGMVMQLIGDIVYMLVDPRIDLSASK